MTQESRSSRRTRSKSSVFELSDPTAVFGAAGHLLEANGPARREGAPPPSEDGAPPDAVPPFWFDVEGRDRLLEEARKPGGVRNLEVRLHSENGAGRVFWVSARRYRAAGEGAIIAVARDVTERSAEADLLQVRYEELASRSDRDTTTGFLIREQFRMVLEKELEKAARLGQTAALILFDFDDFTALNDSHGIAAGDEYLARLGDALRAAFQDGEVLGRVGGDELAIFLPATSSVRAVEEAERLGTLVSKLVPTFEGRPLSLTASTGVAIFPEHARTASELFQAADSAMNQAKRRGRARLKIHDPLDPERERLQNSRWQADRVREALAEQRIVPVFQPVASVTTGRIVSVETLARMRQHDGSLTLPAYFLDAAERFGLVTAIDRIVIAAAFDALATIHRRSFPELEMAVNLSGIDFDDDTLVADISRLARTKGINPGRITFEITETAALRDLARVQDFTSALTAEGFKFALDDFGIGFSSFKYLRELPVTTLKFDISYVQNLPTKAENRVFVRGIAEICRGLGVKTVAEGVETASVLSILRELGVDRAQGHYIGRPSLELPLSRRGTFADSRLDEAG